MKIKEETGTKSDRFFKFVWRFNAIAIACACILGVLVSGYAVISIFKQKTAPRYNTQSNVNLGDRKDIEEKFLWGQPSVLEGTDYLILPLYRKQTYDMAYFSKTSRNNEVNYLFIHRQEGESNWLLKGNEQLFLNSVRIFNKFHEYYNNDDKKHCVAIIYQVIEKDTNADKHLTHEDKISVVAGSTDGKTYDRLVSDVDQVYDISQIADDKFMLLYKKGEETYYEIYDMPFMKLIFTKKVKLPNPKKKK